jgi:hypothetical protein
VAVAAEMDLLLTVQELQALAVEVKEEMFILPLALMVVQVFP